MTIRARYLVIPAALALLVTGCSKDSTGGNGGIIGSGKMSFSYSGAMSGTFSAEGAAPIQNPAGATWALAERDPEFDDITIWANLRRSDGKFNQIAIDVPDTGPGQYAISDDAESQAWAQLHFGLTLTNPPTGEFICDLESGVVTVTSVSNDRIKGTFSGTASCLNGDLTEESTITVTNGQFDTPIYSDDEG